MSVSNPLHMVFDLPEKNNNGGFETGEFRF
jgi:hypothetical protein